MKKIMTLLFIAISLVAVGQQKEGISFQEGSWSELLSKAKAEQKLLFVDAYTTWCGPCKNMTKNVFPKKEVGVFFNANFINATMDMEDGEGLQIAEKYKVESYPTYLFIDGNGKLIHRSIGYVPADEFIEIGKQALDPNKQFYTLQSRYDNGTITDEQLLTLAIQACELSDDRSETFVNSYLGKRDSWLNKNSIHLILTSIKDPENKYFKYLAANEKAAGVIYGETKVRDGLDMIAFRKVNQSLNTDDPIDKLFSQVEAGMKKYRPARNARMIAYQFVIYMADEDDDTETSNKYKLKDTSEFLEEMDWRELNELAWSVYKSDSDQKLIESALSWALKSVSKNSNFSNNDTVAHLYYKLGNKSEALRYAEIALKLGKAAGEDVSETQDLIKKIK